MTAEARVVRRLGVAPVDRGSCTQSGNCPDVFELADDDFAVIGAVSALTHVPEGAPCPFHGTSPFQDPDGVIIVPREVMMAALRHLARESGIEWTPQEWAREDAGGDAGS